MEAFAQTVRKGFKGNFTGISKFTNEVNENFKLNLEDTNNKPDRNDKFKKAQSFKITKKLDNLIPPISIDSLSLHYFSEEELLSLSVCECTSSELNGANTCNDPRMGTTDPCLLCTTCFQDWEHCPAHLGYVKLSTHFLHPFAVKPAIYVLQSVCNNCGIVLLNNENYLTTHAHEIMILSDMVRLKKIAEITVDIMKNKPCSNIYMGKKCNNINPIYEFPKKTARKDNYHIYLELKTEKNAPKQSVPQPIENIDRIFKSINQKDLEIMGFNGLAKPSNFILKVFPIIPETNRPTKVIDGKIDPDQLTIAYTEIIKFNKTLTEAKKQLLDLERGGNKNNGKIYAEAKSKISEVERNVYRVIMYTFNNNDKQYTISVQNDPLISIAQRLTKKEGLFRRNAMGKRVNYTARSVIGPASLPFGFVRFPYSTKALTVPEVVNIYNIKRIEQAAKEGKILNIKHSTGEDSGYRINIHKSIKNGHPVTINIGDTVYRVGEYGDECIFNRQPTLHKQSLMGYSAIYDKTKETFGIHSSATTPHNADFDGDEANKHKPQTLQARSEVRHLINIKQCIMGAQFSRPIIGLVYNSPLSSYLLSQDNNISPSLWNTIYNETFRSTTPLDLKNLQMRLDKHNINKFTGKGILSILFPEDFYYNQDDVSIRNGILIKGILKKTHIGPSGESIIQKLFKYYGNERTSQFITEGQYLLDIYLENIGFSISLTDCMAIDQKRLNKEIRREIDENEIKIQSLGPIRPDMSIVEKDIHENQIKSYLSGVIGKKIGEELLSRNNPLNSMSLSGAKGTPVNIAQIVGALGQQFIKGKRPDMTMTQKRRCLPYFEENSDAISSRGFVSSSYRVGLLPSEEIFHLASARVGLTDTAVKTAETGNMDHRVKKVLEDAKIDYRNAVINASGVIFQFSYPFNSASIIRTDLIGTGNVFSPIDFKTVINKLNYEAGYDI